jgi:hypothetical protein
MFSATDIDPSPAYRTPTEQLTGGYPRRSKRVEGRGRRWSSGDNSTSPGVMRVTIARGCGNHL